MVNQTCVIAISNHKGGVGKTTSSINIGMGLRLLKKKVLLIDLDPQANLTHSLNVDNKEKTTYEVLKGECSIEPKEVIKNLAIVPSHLNLSKAVEQLTDIGGKYTLSEAIEPIKNNYDYILIDCPPSFNILTLNAFIASNKIIVPIQSEYLALQGLSEIIEIINKVKKRLNKSLELGGFIITRYDSRKVLNKHIAGEIESRFKEKVFKTKIRDNVALAEAPMKGLDIFRYNEGSYGAIDYLALSKEILKLNK